MSARIPWDARDDAIEMLARELEQSRDEWERGVAYGRFLAQWDRSAG